MPDLTSQFLDGWDYVTFAAFFVALSVVGYLAGRKERGSPAEYFLAGRKLPWYVVGGSFIASNISSEHFIGMIGAAFLYGNCVSLYTWGNIATFTFLIWLFIPFLLASQVFTIPEFLERRFNGTLRVLFAGATVIGNVVAFLAAVLYGGGVALHELFGWNLWFSVVALGVVAGVWAIWGGLSSVAWTDTFTLVVMLLGGLLVTVMGLYALGDGSVVEGVERVLVRNTAEEEPWSTAVEQAAPNIVGAEATGYQRLSVFHPASHEFVPWTSWIFLIFSVSIWYNVLNQFMIQRVLGARNAYHARMGIVLAGYIQLALPLIIVLPGLIYFAQYPEALQGPWGEVKSQSNGIFVRMVGELIPVGLKGLVLAALFGAIQSTVNSVLNSTSTVVTLDLYKRLFRPNAGNDHLVNVGILVSTLVLAVAIGLAGFIHWLGAGLFEYIQTLYSFLGPPFAAAFLLGVLWRRINAAGAMAAVVAGFASGFAVKFYLQFHDSLRTWLPWMPAPPTWLVPFANQAAVNWAVAMVVCVAVSLCTAPPRPEQVDRTLVFNWRAMNLRDDLGNRWYSSVVTWWALSVVVGVVLVISFSSLVLN